jgi:hypothetical protein
MVFHRIAMTLPPGSRRDDYHHGDCGERERLSDTVSAVGFSNVGAWTAINR